jgi:hypothetical protein
MKFESITEDGIKTPEKKRFRNVKKACVGAAAIASLFYLYMALPGSLENELKSFIGTTNVETKDTTETPDDNAVYAAKFEKLWREKKLTQIILPNVNNQLEQDTTEIGNGQIRLSVVVPVMYFVDKDGNIYTNDQCGDPGVYCRVFTQEQIDDKGPIIASSF